MHVDKIACGTFCKYSHVALLQVGEQFSFLKWRYLTVTVYYISQDRQLNSVKLHYGNLQVKKQIFVELKLSPSGNRNYDWKNERSVTDATERLLVIALPIKPTYKKSINILILILIISLAVNWYLRILKRYIFISVHCVLFCLIIVINVCTSLRHRFSSGFSLFFKQYSIFLYIFLGEKLRALGIKGFESNWRICTTKNCSFLEQTYQIGRSWF